MCVRVCMFVTVYPLLLKAPGQQKADLFSETLKRCCCPACRDQETLSSVLEELLLLATELKNIHTSTQMTTDNSTHIHTQTREEEKDLNCSQLHFDSIISISLRKKIRQKSHYDKWLISERIWREPWRKRDLNRPSLSSPPHPIQTQRHSLLQQWPFIYQSFAWMLTVLHDAFAIAGYNMKSPQSALCCFPHATCNKTATISPLQRLSVTSVLH